MPNFEFNVKLSACIVVPAETEDEARDVLRAGLEQGGGDTETVNFGCFPDGSPILGSIAVDDNEMPCIGKEMTNDQFKHPLPVGFKILSIQGEYDQDGEDNHRHTGINAIGEVVSARFIGAQGWCYGVHFVSSGVLVFLDEETNLNDASKYQAASTPSMRPSM